MKKEDQIHTAFAIERGLYCYKVMPFGLKNARATYQRLMNKLFTAQLAKDMEIYIDNMVVKSKKSITHMEDLTECFDILDRYQMKLNPAKEEERKQMSVFYCSRMLLDTKTRYNIMEKLVLALVTAKNKLRQYFKGHTIVAYTNYPLKQEAGIGIILEEPSRLKIKEAIRLEQHATKNEAEYEALIYGLELARSMGIKRVRFELIQIPRELNQKVDALAKKASTGEYSRHSSISTTLAREDPHVFSVTAELKCWVDPINWYLTTSKLPTSTKEAKLLRLGTQHYSMINDTLYRKSFNGPYLRCLRPIEAKKNIGRNP
ncbi:uncharacterized protein LOC133779682 [Humulus lupulus]|uniref:uncharacterized protein LOC133779682 n=1 Tax=Humulus lupulus TaxID=3486 RepID=UPI002B40209F|nr:uncharacterized protein LOC133779682 [Humulus lupulus]